MRYIALVSAGLALISTSTLAFQEQGGAVVAPTPQAQPAPAEKEVEFSTSKSEGGDAAGTEVRIPGLGKLGVLPKMDFGLELLYGANDASKTPEPEQPAEDLTIRGTVKHNF